MGNDMESKGDILKRSAKTLLVSPSNNAMISYVEASVGYIEELQGLLSYEKAAMLVLIDERDDLKADVERLEIDLIYAKKELQEKSVLV